jgi:hypothetical protein
MICGEKNRPYRHRDTRRFPPPDPESRSPEPVARLEASAIDRLGQQVVSRINLPETSPQASIDSKPSSRCREAEVVVACAHTDGVGDGIPHRKQWTSAAIAAAREFQQIQNFVAACRRQWPGAVIVLRPNRDGPPAGASGPPNSETGTRS